ncbi:hypothetical protein J3F84DRAFT_300459 [Trichoderma pleuroticola]
MCFFVSSQPLSLPLRWATLRTHPDCVPLLTTRPPRVSIGSSSILFSHQLFSSDLPMHNGCCIRHHRWHVPSLACPALPCPALPCPCPEPLSFPTNRSVEELAPGHPQRPRTACLHVLAAALRRFPHTGSGLAKVRPSCVVIRLSYHLRLPVYLSSCFLFPLPSSPCPSPRLLLLPRTGGCELNTSYNPKGIRIFSVQC